MGLVKGEPDDPAPCLSHQPDAGRCGVNHLSSGMLTVGERVPRATVWLSPSDTVSLDELPADGPFLLLFYLFDWSST